jgi:rhodanese-related sulfurtransferase
MPSTVYTPDEVRRLLQDGAQLLDVLAADEFEHDHLPGAINIPLKQLDATSAARLDRNRPVVVYCNDFG